MEEDIIMMECEIPLVRVFIGTTLDGMTPAVIFEFADGSKQVAVPPGEYYDAPKDRCELEEQLRNGLYRW